MFERDISLEMASELWRLFFKVASAGIVENLSHRLKLKINWKPLEVNFREVQSLQGRAVEVGVRVRMWT